MKAGASSFSQKVSIRNRAMIETRSSFSPINFCFSAPIIPGSSSMSASRSRTSSVLRVPPTLLESPKFTGPAGGKRLSFENQQPGAKGRDGKESGFVRGLIVDQNHLQIRCPGCQEPRACAL